MGRDDLRDDVQPEPGSLAVCRVAGFKHVLSRIGRNTGAVIFDIEPAVVELPDSDRHIASPVFDRVPKQILKQLLEPIGVGLDGGVVVDDERSRLLVDHRPAALDDRRQRNGFGLVDLLAFPRQHEQVVDQQLHAGERPAQCVRRGAECLHRLRVQCAVLAVVGFGRGDQLRDDLAVALGDIQGVSKVM